VAIPPPNGPQQMVTMKLIRWACLALQSDAFAGIGLARAALPACSRDCSRIVRERRSISHKARCTRLFAVRGRGAMPDKPESNRHHASRRDC
jgi:hypothetical protein